MQKEMSLARYHPRAEDEGLSAAAEVMQCANRLCSFSWKLVSTFTPVVGVMFGWVYAVNIRTSAPELPSCMQHENPYVIAMTYDVKAKVPVRMQITCLCFFP